MACYGASRFIIRSNGLGKEFEYALWIDMSPEAMQHSKSRMHERAGENNESTGCRNGMSSGISDDFCFLSQEFAKGKEEVCRRERICAAITGRMGVMLVYIYSC